jgi:hypothetical protein
VDATPPFQNPAADDYRTNDGRGVDWAPADQHYGPGADSATTPPAPDDTAPPALPLPSVGPAPAGGSPATPAPGPVDAAPTVDLTSPSSGATAGRELKLAARARDDHGIERIEFWVDRTRVARDRKAPYTATYDARRLRTGSHKVMVRAYDSAGQLASDSVTVRVKTKARARSARVRTHSEARSRSRSS